MTYAVLHNRCVVSMTSYTWLSSPTPADGTNTPPSTLCLSHLRPALAASDFGIQARRCRRHLGTKSMHHSCLIWHWDRSFRPTADGSNERQRRNKMPNVEALYSGTTSLADSQVPGLRTWSSFSVLRDTSQTRLLKLSTPLRHQHHRHLPPHLASSLVIATIISPHPLSPSPSSSPVSTWTHNPIARSFNIRMDRLT